MPTTGASGGNPQVGPGVTPARRVALHERRRDHRRLVRLDLLDRDHPLAVRLGHRHEAAREAPDELAVEQLSQRLALRRTRCAPARLSPGHGPAARSACPRRSIRTCGCGGRRSAPPAGSGRASGTGAGPGRCAPGRTRGSPSRPAARGGSPPPSRTAHTRTSKRSLGRVAASPAVNTSAPPPPGLSRSRSIRTRVRSVDKEPMRSANSLAKRSGGATLNPHLMDESPPMSALSAQRIYERALYVVAPATTAALMVLFRSGEADQALVVLAALIASSLLLWPSGMPMHLMPIAGNALRLFAPVAGTALVLAPGAISAEWPLDPGDMAAPARRRAADRRAGALPGAPLRHRRPGAARADRLPPPGDQARRRVARERDQRLPGGRLHHARRRRARARPQGRRDGREHPLARRARRRPRRSCSPTASTCSGWGRRPRACTCSRRPRGPASTSRSE